MVHNGAWMKNPTVGSENREACPLCHAGAGEAYWADDRRTYLRCPLCALVYVPPAYYPTAVAEKAEYDLHENSPGDAGYRHFLSRLFRPMRARLSPGARGLDFGSGPGPTLSVLFQEAGHDVALYDPFYAPDTSVFDRRYDFITASEVVEHLHRPRQELDRLWRCLRRGGTLGVLTQLVINRKRFSRWRYKDDATHVCFWSRATFEWLAAQWGADLSFVGSDVILLAKR
jgi:hypothetical protein